MAERVPVLPEVLAGLLSFSNVLRDAREGTGVGLEETVGVDFSANFFSVVRFVSFFLDDETVGVSFLLRFLLLILNAGESEFASSAFFVAVVVCFLLEDFCFSVEPFNLLADSFLAESAVSRSNTSLREVLVVEVDATGSSSFFFLDVSEVLPLSLEDVRVFLLGGGLFSSGSIPVRLPRLDPLLTLVMSVRDLLVITFALVTSLRAVFRVRG